MAPTIRYFVVLLITGTMIGCSSEQKMKLSQSVMIGRNSHVSDEHSKTLVEANSHIQCLTACHLSDSCKSYVYKNFSCYHYGDIVEDSDLIEKDGYNYFIVQEFYSPSATTMQPSTTPETEKSTTEKEKTYILYKEKVNWDEAKQECENRNSRLVCIHDKETHDKVLKVIKDGNPDTDIWIGLEALSKQGPFKWTDGTEVSEDKNAGYFHNYLDKDPDLYHEKDNVAVRILFKKNFVEKGMGEKWADCLKSENYWYVCETL